MLARLRAFSVHLSISILIALAAMVIVFYIWYPAPLSIAAGVTKIFLLILVVDAALGPLLTFIVYKKGKKSLKMDLTIIALLQFGALSYGLHTVAEGRPVWLVFAADRFDLVRVADLDLRYADKVKPEYRAPSWTGPRWVAALPPEDAQENSDITVEAVFSGLDLQHRPYLYQPLAMAEKAIQKRALPLSKLTEFNASAEVDTILKRWPSADAWLPLQANIQPMVVLINQKTATVVAVVDLFPWAYLNPNMPDQ